MHETLVKASRCLQLGALSASASREPNFVLPADAELEALAAGLPLPDQPDDDPAIREQVNPVAQLKPLKFRVEGQFRDIPLPLYVSEAIDKHIADHGTTDDGYCSGGAGTSSDPPHV